jgi:hypothetical protein
MLQQLQDIVLSHYIPRDLSILRAELKARHRVHERRFLLNFIPTNSVGAELGVFTGLFSSILARDRRISKITFVDPWWEIFGTHYPDWGAYSDYGRVSTRNAYEVAKTRILQSGLPNRAVEVCRSYEWLAAQDDRSLDWVYLDSTHSYEGTKRELELLYDKVKDTGLILGDDWQIDRNHPHYGVYLAVNEYVKATNFELILCGYRGQWALRREC